MYTLKDAAPMALLLPWHHLFHSPALQLKICTYTYILLTGDSIALLMGTNVYACVNVRTHVGEWRYTNVIIAFLNLRTNKQFHLISGSILKVNSR